MDNAVEFIKAWSTLPIGAMLGFLIWQLIALVKKLTLNHAEHIQRGIEKIEQHQGKHSEQLQEQTILLQKLVDK